MSETRASENQLTVEVPLGGDGNRLDKWLSDVIPETSRTRLRALIIEGAVIKSGASKCDPTYKVKAGEVYTVNFPPPVDARPSAQSMDLSITFEDEYLIVVNKPAGLVVHPAPGNPDRTLVNALLAHCGESLQGIGGVRRPGIVHRIDKGTSGLLVAAKTEAAHAGLAALFAIHDINRRYDAFVWGAPRPAKGTITGAIGRSPRNRKKMAITTKGGKTAQTMYATVSKFRDSASHVQCTLKTGRTHQIRVHMTSIGHPLIGDPLYGSAKRKTLRAFSSNGEAYIKAFSRPALHASMLGFVHPITGKEHEFECPLPDDLEHLKNILKSEIKLPVAER